MSKNKDRNKDGTPNPTSVANRDTLQRLNFLYQASVLLNSISNPRSTNEEPVSTTHADNNTHPEKNNTSHSKTPPRKKRRRMVSFEELSRSYIETMKSVGQKTNVRMDPSVKRRICKRCSAPLIPGISATVRVRDSTSHGHLVSYRCHCCQTERRIPAPPVLLMDPPTNEDADRTQPTENSSTGNSAKRKKGGPRPRLPPHFARDVGHVVFRGNERLDKAPSTS